MINVSVIIPVGPGHEILYLDALRSVQIQHGINKEIIVVNDSGKDLTQLPDTTYLISDFRNVSLARNFGVEYSVGEALVFLDADDMLVPGALLALWTVYKEVGGIIYGNVIRGDNGATHESPEQVCDNVRNSALFKPKRMPTHLIPRNYHIQLGGFDPDVTYFEDVDYECGMDYIIGACATKINYPIYFYRFDTGLRRSYTEEDDDVTKAVKKQLLKKYDKYIKGEKTMGCSSCPGSGNNFPAAQRSVQGAPTPNASAIINEMNNSDLYLFYTGSNPIRTYIGPQTGQQYRFGNSNNYRRLKIGYHYDPSNVASRQNEVHPLDANEFIKPFDRSGVIFEIQKTRKEVTQITKEIVEDKTKLEYTNNEIDLLFDEVDADNEVFTSETNFENTVPFEVAVILGMHVSKLTVDEVKNHLQYATDDVIYTWLEQERSDKQRVTLLSILEKEIESREDD